MEIEIGAWIRLKSDTNKVYRVCYKSMSDEIFECISLQGDRIAINADKIELITDKETLSYLERL